MTSLQITPAPFLYSLCSWLSGRAAGLSPATTISMTPSGGLRSLWYGMANETQATDPHAVLRDYQGSGVTVHDRLPRLAVQASVEGSAVADAAARQMCYGIYQSLLDDDGNPIRMISIPALLEDGSSDAGATYQIRNIELRQTPGTLGRDDRGRVSWVFNFDIFFRRVAA